MHTCIYIYMYLCQELYTHTIERERERDKERKREREREGEFVALSPGPRRSMKQSPFEFRARRVPKELQRGRAQEDDEGLQKSFPNSRAPKCHHMGYVGFLDWES